MLSCAVKTGVSRRGGVTRSDLRFRNRREDKPMRRPLACLIAVLALVGAGNAFAEEGKAPAATSPDFSATRALVEGWTRRERFPDTVTLAYYYGYALRALGAPLDPSRTKMAVDFIRASQREDGGFGSNPKYGADSNVVFTYYSLEALDLLGGLEKVDRDAAARFLGALVREDGSIDPSTKEKGRGTLGSTYYGVGSLARLGRLEPLDKEKTAAFVLAHRSSDDGFAMTRGGNSSPQAVAMAVSTLSQLGVLTPEVREGAVRYLEGAVIFLGTLGTRSRSLATMQSALAIADALAVLDALGDVDTAQAEGLRGLALRAPEQRLRPLARTRHHAPEHLSGSALSGLVGCPEVAVIPARISPADNA